MRLNIPNFLILIGWLTASCTPNHLTEDELRKYILDADHGLTKEVVIDDFKVSATFRPTDLLIAQEVSSPADTIQINRLKKKYGDHYYFVLALSRNGREAIQAGTLPQDQFSELLQTISFRMGAFITLTTSRQDTIPLADFAYTRTFGMGGSNDILRVFNKERITDQQWVQINLAEFGLGLGRQSLKFNCKDLDNIPRIEFTTFNR